MKLGVLKEADDFGRTWHTIYDADDYQMRRWLSLIGSAKHLINHLKTKERGAKHVDN